MTKDEILAAAKEAGSVVLSPRDYGDEVDRLVMKLGALKRFAAIIEKRTIERCAAVADELRHPDGYSAETVDWCEGTKHSAAAIRALGEQ